MNSKYSKLLIILIVIVVMVKIFRTVLFYEEPSVEPKLEENVLGQTSEKVKVSVYYEALCPDSKFFITYQLLPAYKELEDFLIVDLVPYGKAQTIEINGKITFQCQHEALECFANKIHACAIDSVNEPLLRVKYIACMISDNMIPKEAGERCAQELDIDPKPIMDCAESEKGTLLLKQYGKRTHSLSPPVKFIPTIELNETQNFGPQTAVLKDLSKSICNLFQTKPEKCRH